MINQVTRDRINSLSEEYRKLAVKYKEAIKELADIHEKHNLNDQ